MTAIEFSDRMRSIVPSIEVFRDLGFNNQESVGFVNSYIAERKSNPTSISYNDELLNLITNYEASNIEVGMVRLGKTPIISNNGFRLGQVELDYLELNERTGEICVFSFDRPEHLDFRCAENGSNFLDSLFCAATFLTKCMIDSFTSENEQLRILTSRNCSELAGGVQYSEFYDFLLGVF